MSPETFPLHTRAATAFFDSRETAQKAIDDLVAAGIPREQIALTAGQGAGVPVVEAEHDDAHKGFWEMLKDMFLPDEDRYGYAEGLRRGGTLLSVKVDDAHYDRALDILETDGVVDMDVRQASWRQEGWTGYAVASAGTEADATYGNGAIAAPALGAAMAEVGGLSTDPLGPTVRRDETRGRTGPRGYIVDSAGVASEMPDEASSDTRRSFSVSRDSAQIQARMDVIASDGNKVGTVDHLDGPDKIKLAKMTSPDGRHHLVPLDWVDHVDRHVHLSKTTAQVMSSW